MHIMGNDIPKVTSVTRLLSLFSVISSAIRRALIKDDGSGRVKIKMCVVEQQAVHECTAFFRLGFSSPIIQGLNFGQNDP